MLKNFYHYALLMRVHRPIGTLLLLWPTLWAVWLASNGHPSSKYIVIFILGTFLMRSAGCVINDYADYQFDGYVDRTKDRPLATGKISRKEALYLFGGLSALAFLLVIQLNLKTILLACIGLLITILYPFTKRFFAMPQLILGFAFAWGIPMAFAAQLNQLPLLTWLIFFAAILWIIVYDTMYAMTDRQDDLKIGIKSSAILFGQWDRFIIAILQISILAILVSVGIWQEFSVVFYISLLFVSILFIYQQILISDRQPQKCFQAFLNNNWVGLAIFLGVLMSIKLK